MSTALKNLLSNLSFTQYEYNSIFKTALSQLDHLFLVIGNGYEYDSTVGMCRDIRNGKPVKALIRKQRQDFDSVAEKNRMHEDHQRKQYETIIDVLNQAGASEKLEQWMEEYRQIFGTPDEYVVRDESYYFDPEAIAKEFIEYSIAENEQKTNADKYYRTPYPISDNYSAIALMQSTDQPETVRLAVATAKAWLIVLDYYKENGLYLTDDEVQATSCPGSARYKGISFMNEQYEKLTNIISTLEA